MADFAFCTGEHDEKGTCPKRDSCERYVTSKDRKRWSFRQSWMGTAFVKKMDGVSCQHFVKLK